MRLLRSLPAIAMAGLMAAAVAQSSGIALEEGIDRPGSDYRSMDLARDDGPEICMQACLNDKECKAFTFVKAGIQGDFPRCWLKNEVPPDNPDECCTSGVK